MDLLRCEKAFYRRVARGVSAQCIVGADRHHPTGRFLQDSQPMRRRARRLASYNPFVRCVMTMPDERTRSLLWAGGFFIELARDESLPVSIRQRAVAIARHFPTIEDVAHMARFRHPSGLGVGLAMPSETTGWAEDCSLGPLRYSTRLAWPEPPPTHTRSRRRGNQRRT